MSNPDMGIQSNIRVNEFGNAARNAVYLIGRLSSMAAGDAYRSCVENGVPMSEAGRISAAIASQLVSELCDKILIVEVDLTASIDTEGETNGGS